MTQTQATHDQLSHAQAKGQLFIDGQWQDGQGELWQKTDPVSGTPLWSGKVASVDDVNHACQSARRAFKLWARQSLDERIAVVKRFAELVKANQEVLAHIIGAETGKPLWESRTEVVAMIGKVDISIKAYHERTGTSQSTLADGTARLSHRPHGVLAVFGPYNFPAHLPNGHIVPALIAGNAIVFKPSELTPKTAEFTVQLWTQAGLPQGVINLVQGGRTTGEALLDNDEIDGVLFTGSASTGYLFAEKLAKTPHKILALEMGGNNALIIHDIDDVDAVVNLAIQSAFISAGQRCTCARRILVKNGTAGDAFIERFVAVVDKLQIGKFDDEHQPFMGGVISTQAAQNLVQAFDKLVALGGKPLLKMSQPNPNSSIVTPAIIEMTNVKNIPDEEYFGPLTTIYRYDSFDEAIDLANNTRFGLSFALVANDEALFERALIEVRAGIINFNRPTTGAASSAPFGGVGASGNHRPSAYYAADYCAYPVASMQSHGVVMPDNLPHGVVFD